ncbi:hypothetical protein C0584_03020 [Candidatus Parcubacteria bacterium]|nr:MAG: hypothetical protein C0584_03020 [Candidatus Parcubacteria bacterium]
MKKLKLFYLFIIVILVLPLFTNAENYKLSVGDDNVYYGCEGKLITPQTDDSSENDELTFDIESVEILNDSTFLDKNGVYYVSRFNYYCYFYKISGADPETYEILSEDNRYSMDKNKMYFNYKPLKDEGEQIKNIDLFNRLKGRIILKVEDNGEAYYIHPVKQEMYFLSRPVVAFNVMREQGVGITNNDLERIGIAGSVKNYGNDINFSNMHKGKIFLQVEENGEAWYVNPEDGKRYFLGRPTDAFNVMRNLGLGISNNDFNSMIE